MTQIVNSFTDLPEFIQGRNTDEHLFIVQNKDLPNASKTVVSGVDAAAFWRDKCYDIEYLGENSTSKRKLMEEKNQQLTESNEVFIKNFREGVVHASDKLEEVAAPAEVQAKPVVQEAKRVPRGANS